MKLFYAQIDLFLGNCALESLPGDAGPGENFAGRREKLASAGDAGKPKSVWNASPGVAGGPDPLWQGTVGVAADLVPEWLELRGDAGRPKTEWQDVIPDAGRSKTQWTEVAGDAGDPVSECPAAFRGAGKVAPLWLGLSGVAGRGLFRVPQGEIFAGHSLLLLRDHFPFVPGSRVHETEQERDSGTPSPLKQLANRVPEILSVLRIG